MPNSRRDALPRDPTLSEQPLASQLSPCPFCGAQAVVSEHSKRVAINCENPECWAQQKGPRESFPLLVKAWNKRAPSAIALMAQVQNLAQTHRFIFNNEAELQLQIAELLASHGHRFQREFSLTTADRPDFFHLPTGLVIEVKIDGSPYAIGRQVQRYIRHPQVHAVLLISSRPIPLPSNLDGKPIAQASTWRGAL